MSSIDKNHRMVNPRSHVQAISEYEPNGPEPRCQQVRCHQEENRFVNHDDVGLVDGAAVCCCVRVALGDAVDGDEKNC